MKFWEVLKAVEEGKTVQYKAYAHSAWSTWGNYRDTSLGVYESWEWRIKPEPKVIYVNEFSDGSGFSYTSEKQAHQFSDGNHVRKAVKFVEVMED